MRHDAYVSSDIILSGSADVEPGFNIGRRLSIAVYPGYSAMLCREWELGVKAKRTG